MITVKLVRRGLAALAMSLVSLNASAQAASETRKPPAAPATQKPQTAPETQKPPAAPDSQKPFEPVSGQAGKDVIWVPTPQATVDAMLDLAKVTAKDHVIDLGSGNGITVITAAKRGATAHGVEFNPEMVELSRRLAKEAGVADKATFSQGDLFEADLSKATVITLFLLPDINKRLRPSLLELAPGTRVASNTFDMGDWEADQKVTAQCTTSWCTALLWVVPAKVTGTWRFGSDTLTLTQKYQMVEGKLGSAPISAGRLTGPEITFTAGGKVYAGKVTGDTMRGDGWTATRVP
jgi:predicted O-methyltransferase YrrM